MAMTLTDWLAMGIILALSLAASSLAGLAIAPLF